jgi:transposase InsO family protein
VPRRSAGRVARGGREPARPGCTAGDAAACRRSAVPLRDEVGGRGTVPGHEYRVHGRENVVRDPAKGLGYDHFEVVVDDHSRLTYVAHVLNESARSASQALLDAAVWFAGHGVRIERVLTDNAGAYTRAQCAGAMAAIDARHKRTRPHRPQTNSKAARFSKTLLAE